VENGSKTIGNKLIKEMEQGLSFIGVITLCSLALFLLKSTIVFGIVFVVGGTYLGLRGRRKGWSWKR
jgi:hypothetical protein